MWKEPREGTKAADPCGNNKGRRICYGGHASMWSVDRRSSSRSSKLYRSGGTPCLATKSRKAANGVWHNSAAHAMSPSYAALREPNPTLCLDDAEELPRVVGEAREHCFQIAVAEVL